MCWPLGAAGCIRLKQWLPLLPASSNGRDRKLRHLDCLCNPGIPYVGGCVGEPVVAGDSFDDEAAAFVALGACLTQAAWVMYERSPTLWVLETHGAWDPPNGIDFGACVRRRSSEAHAIFRDSPDTPQGLRAAAMLERKLGDYLLAHRCTGHGPDEGMTVLDALRSLDRASPASCHQGAGRRFRAAARAGHRSRTGG